jgi:hypothetical protein
MYMIEHLPADKLKERETVYLQQFFQTDGCLNLSKDALAVMRGIIKTPQHRKRIAIGVSRYFDNNPAARRHLSKLRLGVKMDDSARENMRRSANRGVKHHNSKLTDQAALEIRQKYTPRTYSYNKLAAEYGVDKKTIIRIVKGITWAHVNVGN